MTNQIDNEVLDQCSYILCPDYGNAPYLWKEEGSNCADAVWWGCEHAVSDDLKKDLAEWAMVFECAKFDSVLSSPILNWKVYHQQGIELARKLKREIEKKSFVVQLILQRYRNSILF